MTTSTLRRNDLVEPELSYQIIGAIFDAFRELGPGLREATYQRAVAKTFTERGLHFRQQVSCPIKFHGEKIGVRLLDFLVADKIIVELKCGDTFPRHHILQVKEYLELTNHRLAIIATVTSKGVRFKRIVNIK